MLRCLLVLLVILSLPLRANLGDSIADCVKRYGKPVGYSEANAKSPFGTMAFASGSYTLVVFLLDNNEVGARVSKADKTGFSGAELKTIMNADAASPWVVTESPDPTCQRWIRTDKATVMYDQEKHVVIFTSAAMLAALHTAPKVAAPAAPARPPGDFAPAPPVNWSAVTNTPPPTAPSDAKP